jgi:hypothetical protein
VNDTSFGVLYRRISDGTLSLPGGHTISGCILYDLGSVRNVSKLSVYVKASLSDSDIESCSGSNDACDGAGCGSIGTLRVIGALDAASTVSSYFGVGFFGNTNLDLTPFGSTNFGVHSAEFGGVAGIKMRTLGLCRGNIGHTQENFKISFVHVQEPSTPESAYEPCSSASDVARVTCQPDGSWSNYLKQPRCDPNVCTPALVAPGNGSVSSATGVTGSSSSFACDQGYALSHNSSTVCLDTGLWSTAEPLCIPQACVALLSAPANGSVSSPSGTTGDLRWFACDQGFTLSHTTGAQCLASGNWSVLEPTCVPTACSPLLVAPLNGSVSSVNGSTGDVSVFYCDQGFALSHTTGVQCLASGNWSVLEPICVPTACSPLLVAPLNGSVSSVNGSTGDVSVFYCDQGFTLSHTTGAQCLASGNWSVLEPICVPTACSPLLMAPLNGSVSSVNGST